MQIKDWLIAISVSLLFALGLQYFFGKRGAQEDAEVSGRSRLAPKVEEINRPLSAEVDFIDEDLTVPGHVTELETDFAHYVFSTQGATLEKATFKHNVGKEHILIPIIEARGREDRAFLLVFEEKTPFVYQLTQQIEDDNAYTLTYQTSIQDITVTKRFVVAKHQCRIDLHVDLQLPAEKQARLRLFYPSPMVSALTKDVVQGLVNEGKAITKKTIDILKEGRYWEMPSLFGAEDRYFVYSMTNDPNRFAQRGYFKIGSEPALLAVLESPTIKASSSWNFTFYVGPKRIGLMQAVDPRLNATLEYGWFEPLCKPLLYVLNFFNDYVKNYGLAIILLTLIIKLLLLPFTIRGQMRMQEASKKQKDLQQKLQYLKQKHKDDREAFNREQAELIRKHGMPGFGGCLVLFLQLPIFIALQRILYNAVELYKAPFLWIPDLASSDPYYILPVLVGVGMVLSTGLVKQPDMKQRLFSYALALIVAAVTVQFASGLSLYIAVSTLLTIAQNALQARLQKA